MNVSLDQVLSLFWERPEYINAWRTAFEVEEHRQLLLKKILRFLPPDWGQVQFLENLPGKRFIVLFTHDYDNDGAGRNEAKVLYLLSATGAITFFGVEGATGEIDIGRFRSFRDQQSVRMVADYQFRENELTPLMYVLFTTPTDYLAWGIEDPDLYEAARDKLLMHAPDYWATIERRAPILFENLLLKMDEMEVVIAGVILTQYNFSAGHRWLLDHKIAHAGIVSSSQGPTQFGRIHTRLREDKDPFSRLFQDSSEEEEVRKENEGSREQYNAWRKSLIPNSGVTQWGRIDSGLQGEPYDAAREWKRPADWKLPPSRIILTSSGLARKWKKPADWNRPKVITNGRGSLPMAVMPSWVREKEVRLSLLVTTASYKVGGNEMEMALSIQEALDYLLNDDKKGPSQKVTGRPTKRRKGLRK